MTSCTITNGRCGALEHCVVYCYCCVVDCYSCVVDRFLFIIANIDLLLLIGIWKFCQTNEGLVIPSLYSVTSYRPAQLELRPQATPIS